MFNWNIINVQFASSLTITIHTPELLQSYRFSVESANFPARRQCIIDDSVVNVYSRYTKCMYLLWFHSCGEYHVVGVDTETERKRETETSIWNGMYNALLKLKLSKGVEVIEFVDDFVLKVTCESHRHIEVLVSRYTISSTRQLTYLGVMVNDRLNFNSRVDNACPPPYLGMTAQRCNRRSKQRETESPCYRQLEWPSHTGLYRLKWYAS